MEQNIDMHVSKMCYKSIISKAFWKPCHQHIDQVDQPLKQMCFWCPLLEPHLSTELSNIGVRLK